VRSLAMLLACAKTCGWCSSPGSSQVQDGDDSATLWTATCGYEVESFETTRRPPVIDSSTPHMTRIQKEHNAPLDAESMARLDFSRYCLTPALVARMKEYAPILHPFPRDQHFGEIPPEIDDDPRAMYFRQARNGMWIRAALLAHIFDVDHHISRHFRSEYRELHDYNEAAV
jgi:aspartate carbamoyltransferase catalytic subunit